MILWLGTQLEWINGILCKSIHNPFCLLRHKMSSFLSIAYYLSFKYISRKSFSWCFILPFQIENDNFLCHLHPSISLCVAMKCKSHFCLVLVEFIKLYSLRLQNHVSIWADFAYIRYAQR